MVQILIIYGTDDDYLAGKLGDRLLTKKIKNTNVIKYEGKRYQSLESRYKKRTGKNMENIYQACTEFTFNERQEINEDMVNYFKKEMKSILVKQMSKINPDYAIELHSTGTIAPLKKINLSPIWKKDGFYDSFKSFNDFLKNKYHGNCPFNYCYRTQPKIRADGWEDYINVEIFELIYPHPFKDTFIEVGLRAIIDTCEFLASR